MLDTLSLLPDQFWLVVALLMAGCSWCANNTKSAIGIPAAMVLGTIATWYIGDVFQNNYSETHLALFSENILAEAWGQVAVFLAVFLLVTPLLHRNINRRYRHLGSQSYLFFRQGAGDRNFQRGLTLMFNAAASVWCILLAVAVFRFQDKLLYYFFPLLGQQAGPWNLTGLGGGVETLYALANYLQLMVGAIFGVTAALSNDRRVRSLALIGVLLTWPYYIFDRTRKFVLVIALPGILAWIFLRVRGGMVKKMAIVVLMFLLISAWFGFVIANRAELTIAEAFSKNGFNFAEASAESHQGLNMYEELCWIVMFSLDGRFVPNIGANYFANLVNPIPRSLWAEKPTIGLDYAIARGMGGADTEVGVYATLSNGVVGQGVVNFGLYFGPAIAAILMSAWVVLLARLDLRGKKTGYLPLFGLGLILTFTMGRDITFLEVYPFVFGLLVAIRLNRRTVARHMWNGPAGN